jgi:AraC-like DNA-binding protein
MHVFRFSTAALPARDRLPQWREVFGQNIAKMDMEALAAGDFFSEVQIRALPGLTIATVANAPYRVRRTPALVADGSDDVVFALLRQGGVVASQGSRTVEAGAGDAVLWSNAEAGTCLYPAASASVGLVLSRDRLAAAVGNVEDALMRRISKESPVLALLAGYLDLVKDERVRGSASLQALVTHHVYDLVALALGAAGDEAELARGRGLRAARLRAVKADIAAHLTQRHLTAEWIAARHGISTGYLRKLFAGEETSFTDFVARSRLALAHRRLSDPREDGRTISSIAYECGFGDLSHFNHAFRRRYGTTPSAVRATA